MQSFHLSFVLRPVFVSFLLILIAFWCIQEASRQFACESDPESSAEWLSCSVAVAVAVAVGCTLLAFGIDWKIDCLDKEPNEFLPFAVAQLQLQVVQVAAVATSRCRYPSHSRIIVLPVAQKKSEDRGTLSLSRCSICKCEQFPGQLPMHRSFASSPSLSLPFLLCPFLSGVVAYAVCHLVLIKLAQNVLVAVEYQGWAKWINKCSRYK